MQEDSKTFLTAAKRRHHKNCEHSSDPPDEEYSSEHLNKEHHNSHHSAQKLFHSGCGHESKRGGKYIISSSHSNQVLM